MTNRQGGFGPGTTWTLSAVIAIWAAGAPTAYAQGLGVITGNITDGSGTAVPRAKVTAAEEGTGFERTVFTNEAGHYVIPSLRPTAYTLSVEAQNFRKFMQTGFTLLADQTATLDVQLELGATMQTVTVTGTSPLVDVATPTLTDVVGETRVQELPLNGRAVAQMINLVPGASGASPTVFTSQSSLPGSVSPSINGSRSNQTSYMLDGATFLIHYYNTNIPFPFPDALQEFSVQTSNYSARYGGNAGGVVNVVTKSGTNSLHGDLFEFNRNSDYNARNFFSPVRDDLKRDEFGGAIGGPLLIPHLYDGRDRTFFFFAYQGTRLIRAASGSAYVPTADELKGDFSTLLDAANPNNIFRKSVPITDPLTGRVFAGNLIPLSRFDSAALGLEKYLPQTAGTGQVFYPTPTIQNVDTFITRLDHQIGSKDRLAGRYYANPILLQPRYNPKNLLTYGLGYDIPVRNLMVQETHTFRPDLLNQFSFVYSSVPVAKTAAADSPNPRSFGVMGIYQPPTPFIQSIGVNGYFTISGGAVGPFNSGSFSWQDDITWVHGGHNFSLGASVERSRVDLGDLFNGPGAFTFTADVVNNALAALLIGKMRTFVQGAGEFKNNRNTFLGFYANDSYRVSKRLTLTYGLRYEPYSPWKEIKGRVEQFRIGNYLAGTTSQVFPKAPPGLLFPGDPGMPENGVTGSLTNFAPRAGFAYDLTGDGKTSLRGGAGLFYDTATAGVINNRFADLTPFSPQISVTSPAGPFSNPLLGLVNPFPASFPPPRDSEFPSPVLVVSYDPSSKFQVPVAYNWNLVLERQIVNDWLLQAAYVGSHSSHDKTTVQLNPSQYIPGSSLGTDQRRLFAGYASIGVDGQYGNFSYNSLQLTVKKRMAYGLNLSAAYTFSKSIDDAPNGGNNNDIGADSASAMPWYFPRGRLLDRGPSGFDHAHRFVLSYVWMMPGLRHSNRFARGLFGQWQLSGIATLQSGGPMTVTAGMDRSQTGLGNDRAILTGQPISSSTACGTQAPCVSWLSPNAFALPATGTFGTLGKGALRGPGSAFWDVGLSKTFTIHESLHFQFRGEFFNVTNHVNLNDPGGNVTGAGFGRITGAGDPRIGQLALKLKF